ncbi:hypothetical protein SAMN05421853_1232 [Roseivivax halotolerans]|uniref:Uncharacterized protein n=1 Tax=Roseivivax halotolerans TaxID=93684 RepID=A0A1I6AKA0_9RHOB|nr:hypothetical protein SAMN05421853_1232 [Roseivivax halotolerans]
MQRPELVPVARDHPDACLPAGCDLETALLNPIQERVDIGSLPHLFELCAHAWDDLFVKRGLTGSAAIVALS